MLHTPIRRIQAAIAPILLACSIGAHAVDVSTPALTTPAPNVAPMPVVGPSCRGANAIADAMNDRFAVIADKYNVKACQVRFRIKLEADGRVSDITIVTDTCPAEYSAKARDMMSSQLHCTTTGSSATLGYELIAKLND